jgi:DNA-directed RNA polymerase specialized sigma24 family protein
MMTRATKLRRLTPGQFRVIALLWHEELDYERIAARLGIGVRTVRMHIEYVARDLPGQGPPAWRVLRYAEDLLELGFCDEPLQEKAS